MIEVINISSQPDFGTRPGDYYIGRQFVYKGTIFEPSKYANPFKIGRNATRGDALLQYTEYLYDSGLAQQVRADLADVKRLGCWCKVPGRYVACHGDILAAIAEMGPDAYRDRGYQEKLHV